MLVLATASAWGAGGPGSTSGVGLKLPVGARPTAMGGAFSGLADDLNALYWNPAGLAQVRAPELSLLHTLYLADITYQVVGYAQPLPGLGTLAGSLNLLNYGSIERTVERSDGLYGGEFGSVSPQDVFLTGGWGTALPSRHGMHRLKLGASAKLAFQQLTGNTLVGLGVGGGAFWDTPLTGLRLGALLDNIGALSGTGGRRLPLSWVLGASYGMELGPDVRAIYVMDARMAVDDDASLQPNTGVEISAFNVVQLRGGWRGGQALGGWTYGVGVKYPLSWSRAPLLFKLDYAWAQAGELGASHRFQLGLQFGGAPRLRLGTLRVTRKGGEPVLTWSGRSPGYHVFMRRPWEADFVQITDRPLSTARYALTGFPAGRYVFKVMVVDPYRPERQGPVSPEIEITLDIPEEPSAP